MEEVGIYRLSGATSEVRRLKDAFDNSEYRIILVPPRNSLFFFFLGDDISIYIDMLGFCIPVKR